MRTAYQIDETSLKYAIRKGKIREEVIDIMQEEALCDAYGWTPDYVRNMSDMDFYTYVAILVGKSEGNKTSSKEAKKW